MRSVEDIVMFEVMTDEQYWTFDDNDLLKSVICFIDGKEVDMPVLAIKRINR